MNVSRRSSLTSPQYARKRRQFILRQVAVGLGALVIIVASIVVIARLDIFLIQAVRVEGNHVVTAGEVQTLAGEVMKGNYAWLLPKRNVLLYPKQNLVEALYIKWPRFEAVSVTLEGQWGGHPELVVRVTERVPQYLWCGESPDAILTALDASEACSFVDQSGYLYAQAPTFSGNAYLRLYGGLVDKHFLTPEAFSDSIAFVSTLGGVDFFGSSFKPLSLYATPKRDFEVFLTGGGKVLFTLAQDVQRSIDAFRRVVASEHLVSMPIQYIDLRFTNKVYYKLK